MKKTNIFKVAALTAVFALAGMFANAQETTTDIPKKPNTPLGGVGGSVKVIDNKGTIKYIQTQNGITTFTNLAPDGGIVTTWQLGGTLTDSTVIDLNGNQFALKGLQALDSAGSIGYQLVIVDPVDGKLKRLPFNNLIQKGHTIFPVTADASTNTAITVSGPNLPDFQTVYVYRNGAKLIASEDYNITGIHTVTIIHANVPLYNGDRIEVHFVK